MCSARGKRAYLLPDGHASAVPAWVTNPHPGCVSDYDRELARWSSLRFQGGGSETRHYPKMGGDRVRSLVGHPAAYSCRAPDAQYRFAPQPSRPRYIELLCTNLRLPMGIRVVPNETVPAAVYRVLLPHERRVITVRFHPAILIGPVAWTLGGLAIAGLLSTLVHLSSSILLVVWLAWLVLVIRLLFHIYQWLEDYFVVTSARLLLATGVFKKSVNMMPLGKVTDMRFERSPAGRLFGYGTFIVESAGQDQALSR